MGLWEEEGKDGMHVIVASLLLLIHSKSSWSHTRPFSHATKCIHGSSKNFNPTIHTLTWSVYHVMDPSSGLLHPQLPPLPLVQELTLGYSGSYILWQDHMPVSGTNSFAFKLQLFQPSSSAPSSRGYVPVFIGIVAVFV